MDNLSDLKDALPSNKELPTQNYYNPGNPQRGTPSHRGPAHSGGGRSDNQQPKLFSNTRGAFSNQRGPGRGRSRSAPQPSQGGWGPRGGGTFKFKENASRESVEKVNNYQKAEDELKTIVNHDPNNPNRNVQNNQNRQHNKKHNTKIRNTVEFKPSHEPSDMRLLPAPYGLQRYHREITSRDVIVVSDLFGSPDDLTIYNDLLKEVEGMADHEWKLWHCDSHVIADDRMIRQRRTCPTFGKVIDKIKTYFNMDVQATRFNWYRNTQDWKPYHHDAAAIKPEKAATQNFTVAVSFGGEREASFQHAKNSSTINIPLPNGTMYTFSNDVNVIWRHGIPQVPPEKQSNEGRISIVAWGWVHGVQQVGKRATLGS